MKIQILSDLHFEHMTATKRVSFVNSLDPTGVDVLVLAGDVADADRLAEALDLICKRFAGVHVLGISGNHELYRGTPNSVFETYEQAQARNPNFRYLNQELVVIDGVSFAGATMWFRHHPRNDLYQFTDFTQPRLGVVATKAWIYDQNEEQEAWLRDVIQNGVDVVITHHLPSYQCVAPQYKAETDLNRFFVAPMADELDVLPQVWIYGHTHTPAEFERDGCRFICNPHGYPKESQSKWNPKCVIEVGPQ